MSVKEIKTSDEYNQMLLDPRAIIKLGATWCPPCRKIAPTYEGLASRFTNVSFYKIDVDVFKQALKSEGATSIPFFSTYRNGVRKETLSGANIDKLLVIVANINKM